MAIEDHVATAVREGKLEFPKEPNVCSAAALALTVADVLQSSPDRRERIFKNALSISALMRTRWRPEDVAALRLFILQLREALPRGDR